LPRLAQRAGVEKRVHAHGFRHTHAYELKRRSAAAEDHSATPFRSLTRLPKRSSQAIRSR